jgi:hypothetical protein
VLLVYVETIDVTEVSIPSLGDGRQAAVEDPGDSGTAHSMTASRTVPTLLVLVMVIG